MSWALRSLSFGGAFGFRGWGFAFDVGENVDAVSGKGEGSGAEEDAFLNGAVGVVGDTRYALLGNPEGHCWFQ